MPPIFNAFSRARAAFARPGLILPARVTSLFLRRLAETGRGNDQCVLDAAGDGIYGVDKAGRITFVNRTLCELVGADRAEALVGQDHHHALGHRPSGGDVVAGSSAGNRQREDRDQCALCAAVGGLEPANGDVSLRGIDQEPVPIEFISRPLSEAGRYQGTVITIRDVRERRALDAQYRRARAEHNRLVSVVEDSPNVIVVGRSDGRVQWMNTSGRAILGIAAEEDIRAYTTQDMFSPQELVRIHEEDMPALVRAGRWRGERTLLSRAGESIPVEVSSHLYHDDEFPEGYYVMEIMRDLRPELKQRHGHELARRILEFAGEAYVQFGTDGLVTEWNVQAEKKFGWTSAEATGQPVASLVTTPAERASFERLLGLPGGSDGSSQPARHFEQPMLHRAGRKFPAEVTAWTIEDGAKSVFTCVIRDISERHAAERVKDEFLSVVGHELRTPLTSIHGALGLLRAGLLGELNPRGKQMMDIAAHNTDRLVRLINDILDIERLNSDVALELQSCDVAVLAERSLDVMRSLADDAGVRLRLDTRPAQHVVDPDRIEQTMTNLLSNAIKFSPAGAEVHLVVRSDADGLTIQVRDQGRGIPAEDLERIFDRFQQVDGSDAREKGGTGLGLAICRTITEQHRGRIWAESGPGGGATLTVTLPAAHAEELEVAAEAPGGPKVMVCGEDDSVRARIVEILLPGGYTPVEVATGSLLLDASLQHRPSVIVLDKTAPLVDDREAVFGLRDHPETRDIPVLFLSFDGDKILAESEGLTCLDEPLDVSGLLAAVGEAIGKRDKRPKLLLVEDDGGLADVLTEGFGRLGIEVQTVPTAWQALALCAHVVPDLMVLDLHLPDQDGFQLPEQDGFAVVAQLRRDARLSRVPLAVYSARDLNEADRQRLRLGETVFFTKGRVNPDEFERHVVNLLGQLTQNTKEVNHG